MADENDYDAKLDEFLNLLEADMDPVPQEGGETSSINAEIVPEERIPISSSSNQETSGSSGRQKALSDLTYEDIFGSPEKKKKKSDADFSKRTKNLNMFPDESGSSFTSTANNLPFTSKASVSKIPAGLDTSQLVIDPFSRVRIYKTSISIYFDETITAEAGLKDRNTGLQFVTLSSFNFWFKTKGKDQKNFWVSGVLSRKQSGVRKSAKGNEYVIWEINDLKTLDKSWTVFLFGSASNSSLLSAIPLGSVIDLTTPSVLESGSGPMKFSVSNSNQVRLIATAKDFGFCQSKRKDGKDCTAVVNTWECSVCIHHASSELRKMDSKKKSFENKKGSRISTGFGKSEFSHIPSNSQQDGVMTVNFGKPKVSSKIPMTVTSRPVSSGQRSSRMELQGSSVSGELKRNTLSMGNSSSVSFKQETHNFLVKEKEPPKPMGIRKPIDLDPSKTRHLTEKDREILAALGGSESSQRNSTGNNKDMTKEDKNASFNIEIASRIAANPTAGARNFMRYLSVKSEPESDSKAKYSSKPKKGQLEPIIMTRETLKNMKKALDFVKSNGPIKKVNPNATVKQKSLPNMPSSSSTSGNKRKREIEVEFDFESDGFKKVLNAKSAHEEHLADVQEEEYFDKLSKKEAIENKMLNTYAIDTTAVMCRKCKYVALGQSEFCKQQAHQIRIVKATKRFFRCKDCGNRTMSLDRLPKRPCKTCNSSSWLSAPVGKEKAGPVLANEVLSIRGHEEKFIGSSGSKMFLNLEVA